MTADDEGYDFYPSREALEREFDRIMNRQRGFHPERLDDAVIGEICGLLLAEAAAGEVRQMLLQSGGKSAAQGAPAVPEVPVAQGSQRA